MSNNKSDDSLKLYKIFENYLSEYLDGKQGCADRAILAIQKEIERQVAEAYDNARYWLEDRLTSKKDVAEICATRAAVLRGEIKAPKSRFELRKLQEGK